MRKTTLLLVIATLGCSSSLEDVELDFSAEPVAPSAAREWSVARTESGEHRVTVRRRVWAPQPCDRLQANLLRTSTRLVLRLEDVWEEPQPGSAQPCGYTAVIRNLPTGHYGLRVVHARPGGERTPSVVLEQTLNVR